MADRFFSMGYEKSLIHLLRKLSLQQHFRGILRVIYKQGFNGNQQQFFFPRLYNANSNHHSPETVKPEKF